MATTALLSESGKKAVVERTATLTNTLNAHNETGLDAHDTHVILDTPYLDSAGHQVAPKTLKIGAVIDGSPVFVLIPAIPQ